MRKGRFSAQRLKRWAPAEFRLAAEAIQHPHMHGDGRSRLALCRNQQLRDAAARHFHAHDGEGRGGSLTDQRGKIAYDARFVLQFGAAQ